MGLRAVEYYEKHVCRTPNSDLYVRDDGPRSRGEKFQTRNRFARYPKQLFSNAVRRITAENELSVQNTKGRRLQTDNARRGIFHDSRLDKFRLVSLTYIHILILCYNDLIQLWGQTRTEIIIN